MMDKFKELESLKTIESVLDFAIRNDLENNEIINLKLQHVMQKNEELVSNNNTNISKKNYTKKHVGRCT